MQLTQSSQQLPAQLQIDDQAPAPQVQLRAATQARPEPDMAAGGAEGAAATAPSVQTAGTSDIDAPSPPEVAAAALAAAAAQTGQRGQAAMDELSRLSPLVGLELGMNPGKGLQVKSVRGPARAAGIRPGAFVSRVDGTAVATQKSFQQAVGRHLPGDRMALTISEHGEVKRVNVLLGAPKTTAEEIAYLRQSAGLPVFNK